MDVSDRIVALKSVIDEHRRRLRSSSRFRGTAVPKREAGRLPVPSRKPAPCLYLAKVIAQKSDKSVGAFDTSPQILKEPKKAGVHDSIILAMVKAG